MLDVLQSVATAFDRADRLGEDIGRVTDPAEIAESERLRDFQSAYQGELLGIHASALSDFGKNA